MIGRRTLGITLAAAAVALLAAGAAFAQNGNGKALYVFRGHLQAAVDGSPLSLQVEGGNRRALRAMLGASVEQSFAIGDQTEFLRWSNGTPAVVHAGDLAAGDWIALSVRAPRGASIDEIEQQAAGIVSDRGTSPNPPSRPLYLFRGTLVSTGADTVTLDVRGGNRRALRLLVGQGSQQTFATGQETIFLLWQGKVPTVISASDLKAGDRVTVRIRAEARSTLDQVEATAAVHVGDREPASTTVTS